MMKCSRHLVRFLLVLVCFVLVGPGTGLAADTADDASDHASLLFHLSFDETASADHAGGDADPVWPRRIDIESGRVGNAARLHRGGSTLAYPMDGNAFVSAGTLSFFWRLDAPLDKAEFPIINLGAFQKVYFGRWIRLTVNNGRLRLALYESHFSSRRIRMGVADFTPEPDQWYHIAIAWDQTRGIALYLDGERVVQREMPWFLDANVNQIGFGQRAASYVPAGRYRTARDQSFDEVRVYDHWLEDQAIASLADAQTPNVRRPDVQPLMDWRREVFAWNDVEGMPRVSLDPDVPGAGLRQVGVVAAKDVKRIAMTPLDGQLATPWKGRGYAESGEVLNVQLEADASFDVVQAFGIGAINVTEPQADAVLADWENDQPSFAHAVLDTPADTEHIAVRKTEDAILTEVMFYEQVPFEQLMRRSGKWESTHLTRANNAEARDSIQNTRREREFPWHDRTLFLADADTASDSAAADLRFPAMRPVHILGPQSSDHRGLGGIALDLEVVSEELPEVVRVEVVDPLNHVRRAFTADVAVIDERDTAKGRRLRLAIDLRDLVLPPNIEPWLMLTFSHDVRIQAAQSSVHFQWIDVETALEAFHPDQLLQAREVFSWLSEARPWGWNPEHTAWLGYLHSILKGLLVHSPEDSTLRGYWHWINPRDQKPTVALPSPPPDLPAWAFYLDENLPLLKRTAYWWIDNRMTDAGEFGANDGINDDTVLVQDWLNLHLMQGPDEKLRDAVTRVADNSWRNRMEDGLGSVTDSLHHYEWGLNAQSLHALMNYGDPITMERLMATVRHYDALTRINEQGHRHFISNEYGYQAIKTAGPLGWDEWGNALTLQPAMLLAWYNGNEYAQRVLIEWTDAMLAHGDELWEDQRKRIAGVQAHHASGDARLGGRTHGFLSAVWACYHLTKELKYLDTIGRYIELELELGGTPRLTNAVVARYLSEADRRSDQLDESAHERFVSISDALADLLPDETLWEQSLHNSGYNQLDWFYYKWQVTDNVTHLDEGTKLALNDITWALPMLTLAEQSTDRVWIPERLVNRISLGGSAILRNELYPRHAVSWEHASGRFAPLVETHEPTTLQVVMHNLEDQPLTVDMRVWELEHGRYRLTHEPVTTPNGADGSAVASEADLELARYSSVPVSVPANSAVRLTLEQVETLPDIRDRADLAVSARDAQFDPDSRELTLRIHNIGSRAADSFAVQVRQENRTLKETTVESLDAPTDLSPRIHTLRVTVDQPDIPVTVELDPDGVVSEITRGNNKVEIDCTRAVDAVQR